MYSAIEHSVNMALYKCCIIIILVWTTSLDTSSRSFICVCVCVRVCIRPRSWPHNVELRNYVISRQNFIKSSYIITGYVISRQNFIK